ncbi:MAG: hypothetical protein QME51_07945, partial [Planctomycetota bacterium]|nr:hypothetical protein [Planctomycetota bacterium]
ILDLVYMGIIGLGTFIWLLVRMFRTAYPLTKQSSLAAQYPSREIDPKYIEALSIGYLGGFIALLIHSIAVTTFYNIRTMIPFWFLTGLIIVLRHLIEEEKQI